MIPRLAEQKRHRSIELFDEGFRVRRALCHVAFYQRPQGLLDDAGHAVWALAAAAKLETMLAHKCPGYSSQVISGRKTKLCDLRSYVDLGDELVRADEGQQNKEDGTMPHCFMSAMANSP